MTRALPNRRARLERFILKLIQHEGDDQGQPRSIRWLLSFLEWCSNIFGRVVEFRAWLYETGLKRRFPLGCQVISVGNVTVGGTGKTPVVEILARTLRDEGRVVAIISRGYRKKESPFLQRLLEGDNTPPRVVSDGQSVLLGSDMSGDEPYMLASNLPGVAVLVDKNRVKAGRYAIRHFGCDVLILDDGFQYMKLRHSHEIVLVDSTNPFGNGHLLPRGILREPAENIARANFIFITKCDGGAEALKAQLRRLNPTAEMAECRHRPRFYRNAYNPAETLPLEAISGMKVVTLAGIAAPMGFENSVSAMGGRILARERYPDHYRYREREIAAVIDNAAELGAQAILTTEKDAVRIPRIDAPKVPIYYMRMEIEIVSGFDNFRQCVDRICMD